MTLPTDCWNRIGVRGDASCPELADCAHCRHCATYSASAARLLYVTSWECDEAAIGGMAP